jgi:hypothetical protein
MKVATLLFLDCFMASAIQLQGQLSLNLLSPGKPDRYLHPKTLQLPQQPKTKPDDAFKMLGCCGTVRDNKRTDEARNATAVLRPDEIGSRAGIDMVAYA